MIPLHCDSHLTFRFVEDWIIPCFHLDGVDTGVKVSVYKFDPATETRQGLIATATINEGGWVDLPEPIVVRNGEGFIAIPQKENP